MRLKVLGCGTSTGVPIPGCKCDVCSSSNPRNHRDRTSSIITLGDGKTILIDAGPDLRQQAIRWQVNRVDAILFTHAHADHILGIDDIRGFNIVQQQSIPCYGSAATLSRIREMFSYIFEPNPHQYEGGLLASLKTHEIEAGKPFDVLGTTVVPFTVFHGKLPVMGFRVGDMGYATDCNQIPVESKEQLKSLKYLFLDGLRYEAHATHFTIPKAIETAQELAANQTYLIHMTHSVDYDTVSKQLPKGIALAYDGLEVEA